MNAHGIGDELQAAADDLTRRLDALQASALMATTPEALSSALETLAELQAAIQRHQRLCQVVLLSIMDLCGKAEIEQY